MIMLASARYIALLLVSIPLAQAQRVDTVLTWRTYSQEVQARVQVFDSGNALRPTTAVIDELASNRGAPVTDDTRFLAETIGRQLGEDPAEMTFVFRFSAASYCETGSGAGKTLLLRATFSRTRAGGLASPSWRVISRDELAQLTDRALY